MPHAHAQRYASVTAATQRAWASAAPALQHKSTQLYIPCLPIMLWDILAASRAVGFTHTPFTSKLSIPLTPASHRIQAQRRYACALVWDTQCGILLQLLLYNEQMFSVNTCEDLHESHNAETSCRLCCTTSRCTVRSTIRGSCQFYCQLCSISLTSEFAAWTQRLG